MCSCALSIGFSILFYGVKCVMQNQVLKEDDLCFCFLKANVAILLCGAVMLVHMICSGKVSGGCVLIKNIQIRRYTFGSNLKNAFEYVHNCFFFFFFVCLHAYGIFVSGLSLPKAVFLFIIGALYANIKSRYVKSLRQNILFVG